MQTYSFKKGFWKAIISMILVGTPVIASALPAEWMNLTVGGLLVILQNYLKFKFSK